jgi:hypothetical protein
MKRNLLTGILFLLTMVCARESRAQNQTEVPVGVPVSSMHVSMSVETGHYDPDPSCKKEIDGCFPKVWHPSPTFEPGSRIWLKVTLFNRSKLALVSEMRPEYPPVRLTVRNKSTGSSAKLTRKGCQLRPGICVPQEGDTGMADIILSGLSSTWIIPPGKSESTIVEISEEYAPNDPGIYTASVDSQAFCVASMSQMAAGAPIDTTGLKPAGLFKSNEVSFTVTH